MKGRSDKILYVPTRLDHSNSRLANGWLRPGPGISRWMGSVEVWGEVRRSRGVEAGGGKKVTAKGRRVGEKAASWGGEAQAGGIEAPGWNGLLIFP